MMDPQNEGGQQPYLDFCAELYMVTIEYARKEKERFKMNSKKKKSMNGRLTLTYYCKYRSR